MISMCVLNPHLCALRRALDENGALRLHIYAQFSVNDLKGSYSVAGPDGPADAKNKMLFRVSLLMKGKE